MSLDSSLHLLDQEKRTLGEQLRSAAVQGRVDEIRSLVQQHGAEILEITNARGETAAHFAACHGLVDVLQFLAEECPSRTSILARSDHQGNTPAHTGLFF